MRLPMRSGTSTKDPRGGEQEGRGLERCSGIFENPVVPVLKIVCDLFVLEGQASRHDHDGEVLVSLQTSSLSGHITTIAFELE